MKKILIPALFCCLLVGIAALGGMYLGSLVYTQWMGLKSAPSVFMLPTYWQHLHRLPQGMVFPLQASTAPAAILPLAVLLLCLISLFRAPKRELHGSSRFANKGEIGKLGLLRQKFKPDEDPDILIGKYGKHYLRWSGNEFLYLAAPTRSGKGVGIVIPNCLHYRDSMVVYDPKLENFLITAGFRAQCGHKVFLFNPAGRTPEHERNPNAPLVSHKWNPLTYVRRNPLYSYKDIKSIAEILYPPNPKSNDNASFFQVSAQNLFAGLLLYMIETESERDLSVPAQKTTLANLFRLTTPANGKTLAEWIRDEFELRAMQPHTRLSRNCETLLMGFANGNAKTGADILATVTAPLGIFIDPVVEAATSGDDFYLDDIRKQRMAVYIGVIPTDTGSFSRLTNLFFAQLINVNVQQGLPVNNPGILKYQCLLLMDEFTALGAISAVQHGVSYLAGYGLRLMPIIQTPSQVTEIYGRDATRTFFTNFGCQIVFPPREQTDAEEYSKLIGYETFKAKSVSRSSGKSSSRSNSISDQKRAVMNPDELKMMPKTDCIISIGYSRPIYAQKIVYWQDPVFMPRANLPLPYVPALVVHLPPKAVGATPKAEPVPAEVLASFRWQDAANAEDIAKTLLRSLIPPGSPPEYVAQLVPVIAKNWGSLSVVSDLLKETSGVDAGDLPDAA